MDEVVISPTGLGFNAGYWSLVLGWATWYLVRWKTDVPLGVWGKAAALPDEVVKLLNEQEARGRRKAKALEEQVAPDRNAMSPVASSEASGRRPRLPAPTWTRASFCSPSPLASPK